MAENKPVTRQRLNKVCKTEVIRDKKEEWADFAEIEPPISDDKFVYRSLQCYSNEFHEFHWLY